jgi:hypothetical protein
MIHVPEVTVRSHGFPAKMVICSRTEAKVVPLPLEKGVEAPHRLRPEMVKINLTKNSDYGSILRFVPISQRGLN